MHLDRQPLSKPRWTNQKQGEAEKALEQVRVWALARKQSALVSAMMLVS